MSYINKYPYTDITLTNIDAFIQKVNELGDAENIRYDNTESGLQADNVQDALNELDAYIEEVSRQSQKLVVVDNDIPEQFWEYGHTYTHLQTWNQPTCMAIVNAIRNGNYVIIRRTITNGGDTFYDYYIMEQIDYKPNDYVHKVSFTQFLGLKKCSVDINGLNDDQNVAIDILPDAQGTVVSSFNGRDGAVTPEDDDYNAGQIVYDNTTSQLIADRVQSAIDELDGDLDTAVTNINNALALKQDALTFDNTPTSGSNNPVKSGGIYDALATKQNALTFDLAPTENSTNPVTSGGVYDAISQAGVGVVSSVFGRTGIIVATSGDYDANQVDYDNTVSGLLATSVQGAIDELASGGSTTTLAGCTDVNIVSPTDGQVLKYNGVTHMWYNGTDVSGLAPDDVSDLSIVTGNTKVTILWSDPADTVISGETLCTWASTKLVMKTGGYPANENDGTVVVSNAVRDQYKTTGYEVTGLTNDTTYYFQLFPVSDGGAVNRNVANQISGTPTDSISITFTVNGAKEDNIVITDHLGTQVGTCVFGSGQTSGTVTITIPASGGNYTFESTVAKAWESVTNYTKVIALDSNTTSVDVYPVPTSQMLYWFGNKFGKGWQSCSIAGSGRAYDCNNNSQYGATRTFTDATNYMKCAINSGGNNTSLSQTAYTSTATDLTGYNKLCGIFGTDGSCARQVLIDGTIQGQSWGYITELSIGSRKFESTISQTGNKKIGVTSKSSGDYYTGSGDTTLQALWLVN